MTRKTLTSKYDPNPSWGDADSLEKAANFNANQRREMRTSAECDQISAALRDDPVVGPLWNETPSKVIGFLKEFFALPKESQGDVALFVRCRAFDAGVLEHSFLRD
ncbi:hypothetical protein [Blastopirellula marina]|uniref:Uncharacterized protein n=1 Tax=Blastopirellula marina TaxID=124 RepID=A0A2S8GID7_9BACT|nr:hypothetical protein [Blastopirellula marina]PQO44209.1 hypothetical protein C5Y93_19750 [Blastopirellula marina]